jgi:hypothetical protein
MRAASVNCAGSPFLPTWGLNYKASQKFNNRAKNIAGLN